MQNSPKTAREGTATRYYGPYVYILHFEAPLGTERHMARHYVGYARNWVYRVGAHHRGDAKCKITRAFWERGIAFRVALVVHGDRRLERRIKRAGHYDRHCPLCGGCTMVDYRDAAPTEAPMVH